MAELLHPARLERQGIFHPGPITGLVRAHRAGRIDARKKLWTLITFQRWLERYLPGGAVA